MDVLDPAIAMQIVSRTMSILGHNVNVMNSRGVILGSGDNLRIGAVHEGALLAITQNRVVEITAEVASGLIGVKPGINLPLHYQGEIIGVIGITGEFKEITPYGQLLKMTAEMIVEQANLQDNLQWENRQKEAFILQLVKGELPHKAQLTEWAAQLGVSLETPRVAAIIEVSDLNASVQHDGHGANNLKEISRLLQHPERDNLVAMTSLNQLVILKPALLDGKQWDPILESTRIDSLLKRLPAHLKDRIKIALGHYFPSIEGIAHSYQTAQETLSIGKQMNSEERKYLFEDYSLQVLLSGLKHNWRGEVLSSHYKQLQSVDKKGVLRKTLAAYTTHFGDLQHCANALHIHRNTLRYRLDKIQAITHVDIHTLDGLFSLYLGQLITDQ
ncbi:CdaR family transcriptional regulator [Marinomonas sp. M1K-6]|uniref:CdaR family transcriptional regulator n=1 Tax=Marinomonas profundi TaxID=2726122 RepID=A0A847R0T6_9GAMM|nr:sugar diacid recognition domain-containing protein [Marinomonas profundi]NLQ17152.1 CdaR family transcriptional regulator [Marinomonas profundi]UDV04654.1 helix-turn-helix domain-containing protein [Marinomonas profundi]